MNTHTRLRTWVKVVLIIIILLSSIVLYSYYIGTKGLITKEYAVVNKKIPSNFYGFKIVQISDIHYKVSTTIEDLNNISREINKLKPDIILFTGDLFDKKIKYSKKDYDDLKKFLSSLNSNIAKYSIKGEQDLKFNEFEEIMSDAGFINLNNTYEYIYYEGITPIILVGINSNYNKNHIKEDFNTIGNDIDNDNFKILMLHEPDFINKINYSTFDLIFAGHSHNAQINIPYIKKLYLNKYSKNYYENFYDLNSTKLYISSGIGTHNFKFRLLNKPSINFYRLRNK
ncbi:MAG: metallophosphoesterase [bacterium]|nr:metallophosphoesterase [bacterium]